MDVEFSCPPDVPLEELKFQKLEEKAQKAQEAFEREEKAKKELEGLYAKLLAEKTELLSVLESEKGSLGETQERAAKLQAQKSDLESQLSVSTFFICFWCSQNYIFLLYYMMVGFKICTHMKK